MTEHTHSDKITQVNEKGDIVLPIGHYALINGNMGLENKFPIISIYGLGSCIALILFDKKNRICGMSHVLLPKSRKNKEVKFPHKYANLSVKYLLDELIDGGAQQELIKAIIVGGSKIFDLPNNYIGEENVRSIKHELDNYGIKIIKKSLGGSKGKNVKFNTQNYEVFVRISGEKRPQKL